MQHTATCQLHNSNWYPTPVSGNWIASQPRTQEQQQQHNIQRHILHQPVAHAKDRYPGQTQHKQQPAIDPAPYDLVQHLAGESTRLRCCLTTAGIPQHAAKRAPEGCHPAAKHITPADAAAAAGTPCPHSTGNLAKCSRTACTRRMQACLAGAGARAYQPTSCFGCVGTAAKARRKHTCSNAVQKASGFTVHCPAAVSTYARQLHVAATSAIVHRDDDGGL